MVWLVWTLDWDTNVGSLLRGQLSELNAELAKVQTSDFLVQDLWKEVDAKRVLVRFSPEGDLSQGLVGERAGHDERWVSASAAEVDKSTRGQQDESTAVWQVVAIDLWLDVDNLGGHSLELLHLNFAVEVTNVAQDGVRWEELEVLLADDVLAASGGNDDVGDAGNFLQGGDLVAFHSSLQSVDWVNFSDDDTSTHATEGGSASLADVTIAADNSDLTGNHNVSSALDTV